MKVSPGTPFVNHSGIPPEFFLHSNTDFFRESFIIGTNDFLVNFSRDFIGNFRQYMDFFIDFSRTSSETLSRIFFSAVFPEILSFIGFFRDSFGIFFPDTWDCIMNFCWIPAEVTPGIPFDISPAALSEILSGILPGLYSLIFPRSSLEFVTSIIFA